MEHLFLKTIASPVGELLAGASRNGICLLEFFQEKDKYKHLQKISAHFGVEPTFGESPYFEKLEWQLEEYFSGNRKEFDVSLDIIGTDFQKKVWQELLKVPYGSTISYLRQATQMGNPKAVRAVANANGANKIPIIIPCHRIIGANGKLVGFGGGLPRKKFLLNLEKKHSKTGETNLFLLF